MLGLRNPQPRVRTFESRPCQVQTGMRLQRRSSQILNHEKNERHEKGWLLCAAEPECAGKTFRRYAARLAERSTTSSYPHCGGHINVLFSIDDLFRAFRFFRGQSFFLALLFLARQDFFAAGG